MTLEQEARAVAVQRWPDNPEESTEGRDMKAGARYGFESGAVWAFERGARAVAESMRFYFCDENEHSIHPDLSDEELEQIEKSAVADVLREEEIRTNGEER